MWQDTNNSRQYEWLQRNMFNRPRINTLLREHIHNPLVFVSAPMGYGKTMAVRNFILQDNANSIWVSALYNDDILVWKKICEALAAKHEELGRRLHEVGFPASRFQVSQVIDIFKNAVSASLVMVIDDYHLLSCQSPLQHVFFALAMENIHSLHIICIARFVPRWLLAELLSKELCGIVTADMLALTKEEVAAYLHQRKLLPAAADAPGPITATSSSGRGGQTPPAGALSGAAQAERIWELSEGWIAATVLLAEGLRLGQEVMAPENTHTLFERTIFHELDEAEKRQCIQLAVLEEFSMEEAVFALDAPEVPRLIERLHSQKTFITYCMVERAYRLHTLFRAFLLHKAPVYDIDINPVLRRAGKWHYMRQNFATALNYYNRCDSVREFFAGIASEERVNIPYSLHDSLYEIVRRLPLEATLENPRLYLYFALIFFTSGIAERERLAQRMVHTIRRHFIRQMAGHPELEQIACEVQIVEHLLHFNNPYVLFDYRKCLLRSTAKAIVLPFARTTSLTAGLPSLLYCFYRKPGELTTLVPHIIENFDCDLLGGTGYGFDKLLLAEQHLECGDMEKARFYAEQAVAKAWLKEQFFVVACAHCVLARVCVFMGDVDGARAQLEAIKFGVPRRLSLAMLPDISRQYTALGDLCEGLLYCCMQQSDKLPASLNNLGTASNTYMFRGMGMLEIIRIKCKLLNGEYAEAEVLCDYYEKEFLRHPALLGLLRVKVYRAVVNQHLHGTARALEALEHALETGAPDGIVLLFTENADAILPLLGSIRPSERLTEGYLQRVRQVCRRFSSNCKRLKVRTGPGVLSPREAEVFRLLAEGKSQKNIAASLSISVSTVKRHLESIYNKLGVNNRVAALNMGFTLGL